MLQNFFTLTPDQVLDAVESALGSRQSGVRATGKLLALNSVENRVYSIEFEDADGEQSWRVAKFYRPARWRPEQVLDEHRFTQALADAEVPVVPALALQSNDGIKLHGPTLAETADGIAFAIFPKALGRLRDELDQEQLQQVGRFLARLHAVGSRFGANSRLRLDVDSYGREPLALLLASPFLNDNQRARYKSVVEGALARIEPLLKGVPVHLTHGDCHSGNILWSQAGPFFLDFDDIVVAPPVQDVWMVVRGRDEEAVAQRDALLRAYETMRPFDRNTLKLIEPLRALRMIHYAGWIARRWDDPAFPRMFPFFGSEKYWAEEIDAIERVREAIEADLSLY